MRDIGFVAVNLEEIEPQVEKYDLAICLEVAEHLRPAAAETFIKTLTSYSNTIIFSAAVPDQGGQNHLNEQWPAYWRQLFEKQGFILYDAIRPLIWEEPAVDCWYRQNIFFFINEKASVKIELPGKDSDPMLLKIIHPESFQYKSQMLERIMADRFTFKGYVKMFLKYFINLFRN
jgi:hypothetical protein